MIQPPVDTILTSLSVTIGGDRAALDALLGVSGDDWFAHPLGGPNFRLELTRFEVINQVTSLTVIEEAGTVRFLSFGIKPPGIEVSLLCERMGIAPSFSAHIEIPFSSSPGEPVLEELPQTLSFVLENTRVVASTKGSDITAFFLSPAERWVDSGMAGFSLTRDVMA